MAKGKSENPVRTKGIKNAETGTYRDKHGYAPKGIKGEDLAVKGNGKANWIIGDVKHVHGTGGDWDRLFFTAPVSEKITIIKNGISKKELETIKEQSDLDYETLSSILSVSKAKLHSKKGADKFDQNTSERIMLLADVVAYGQSVFEDKDSFNEWLKANNKALGNKAPIELMDTIYGIDEVKKEIGRIEYGVF